MKQPETTPESTSSQSELEVETDQLLEAMRVADMVTLEFGTGETPLFEATEAVQFDAKNVYIGVNVDPRQHALLAEKVSGNDGFAVLAKFEDESLNLLPLPDASVDAVFMGDVLGEPDSNMIMEPFKDADGIYHGNSDMESKIRTLEEAVRLLRSGGELIILENKTPYIKSIHREPGDKTYSGTVEILEALGLGMVATKDRKDAEWDESVRDYATPAEWWSNWSYLVIAKKLE